LITCDQDDSLYVALDEATKQAPVEVVFGQSFWAGASHASGPLSGECLGIIAGRSPADVREGLAACMHCLEEDACFYTANDDGSLLIFPHVVAAIGDYLAQESGLEPGTPLAYLIAPPLEAVVGIDAALKAADVSLQRSFSPPTPTNFAGGYLTGPLEQCEAAAVAFAEAVVDLAANPRVL
jgi:ethanolamine utilization protein EutL